MKKALRFSPVLLLVIAACSGGAGPTPGGAPAAGAAGAAPPTVHVTHLLPPGGESTASLRTLPDAVCSLGVAGAASDEPHLRVYSDDDGIARVHVRQIDASVDHGQLALDCTDDAGRRLVHAIDVRVDEQAASQSPLPFARAGKPVLPRLDVDPATLSDDDVFARHLPPRPDAARSPGQYSAWLALASSGATVITPHLVADPSRVHGPAHVTRTADGTGNSNNWSGYVITTPASSSPYVWIYGEWSVPRAYAESGFYSSDHSTLWVGIDGWGTPDVVQDGTDQDTLTAFWVQTSSYDAWTEWYPLTSQTVSNFPVNPGDDIHTWTWLRASNGAWSTTPTVGWFYIWNATENAYAYTSTNVPSGTTFNGHTAEWIMERPTVNGSLSTLAQYASPTTLTNAAAYDVNGGAHEYTSDTSWQISMVNSSDQHVLSTVAPDGASGMQFTWVNHD